MSISRSRSRSVRVTSRKRKASRSLSSARSLVVQRGTNHSGNLPLIGKPLFVSHKAEKIANSLAAKLTLPIELFNDFSQQVSPGPGVQSFSISMQSYTPTDISNIFYYAAATDSSNMQLGNYENPDQSNSAGASAPFKVQCLGCENSLSFTNVANMDCSIDVYVCEPRRDIYEHLIADGWSDDMKTPLDWIENNNYNNYSLDHTSRAGLSKNLAYTDPRCSLYDRHGFLKDWKIVKTSSFVLSGGESRSFIHADPRRHVLDSQIHSPAALRNCIGLRGLLQTIVLRVRGQLCTSNATSTADILSGFSPAKVNIVLGQKYIFKRIKMAARQQIFESTSLSVIPEGNCVNIDPEQGVSETYSTL